MNNRILEKLAISSILSTHHSKFNVTETDGQIDRLTDGRSHIV